jgi:glycosyltransferase involved in cell wall biosynthesis
MTGALLERLVMEPDLELTGILVSWRGRGQLVAELPPAMDERAVAFPARLAHRLWARMNRPRVRGFDVVHGPNFVVPPAGGAAELVTIHDFGPWHYPQFVTKHARAYPRLVTRALGRGAHLHVVSSFVAAEAKELLRVEPERIHVIHNGLDRGLTGDPVRGRTQIGSRYVVAVGTVEPRKDLPTLVAAMSRVWAIVPDLRLVLVGADGWGTADLEGALKKVPGGDRVIRLGYVPDQTRADLMAGATCLAYPSLYEGFGLPPLEAMAQSTPVVTTTAGALPEVCGDAAMLVAPGDTEGLAEAIVALATDPERARLLVDAGHQRITQFSWDDTAHQMAALYRQLAGR